MNCGWSSITSTHCTMCFVSTNVFAVLSQGSLFCLLLHVCLHPVWYNLSFTQSHIPGHNTLQKCCSLTVRIVGATALQLRPALGFGWAGKLAAYLLRLIGNKSRRNKTFKVWVQWLPRWFSGKESFCQCRRHGFHPWSRKIPWRRKRQPTPVFLSGKSHGQRSLVG